MSKLSVALFALGAVLILVGVGAVSLPAAAILAGIGCTLLAWGETRADGPSA